MKKTSSTNINSDAQIEVSYSNGVKKILDFRAESVESNTTLADLSLGFANFLIGKEISSYIPATIDIVGKYNGTYVSILKAATAITGSRIDQLTSSDTGTVKDRYNNYFYRVEFNTLVTNNSLKGGDYLTCSEDFQVLLLSGTGLKLASFTLTDIKDISTLVAVGKNLIIRWRLKLCNISSTTVDSSIDIG